MASEYKQCPNGHYYQGTACPYCKNGNNAQGSKTSLKTEIFEGDGGVGVGFQDTSAATVIDVDSNAATVIDNIAPTVNQPYSNRTVFGDEEETETGKIEKTYRSSRKLVGWLVSYTLNDMGVDYKLYEGRNIIGRDNDCNITVNDKMVSGKHAVILFRADKYSISDQQSSHGTFVNDEDIELAPHYIKDGDIIRIGETVFKFRSSLF